MRKISIKQLMEGDKTPKLERQNEYLLSLYNDDYSDETVYNYNRDLSFFAEYLLLSNTTFDKISKLTITYFKGWLKERNHIHQRPEAKEADNKKKDIWSADNMGTNGKNASKTNDVHLNDREHPRKLQKGGFVKNNNPEQLAALSINRILVALRNYLRFLIEYDYPSPIAPDAVSLVRLAKTKSQVPSLEEVVALVEAPTHYESDKTVALRNRAALELLLATGMRISEVVSINRDQINGEGKLLVRGKGRKERFVYLTPRAVAHVQEYLQNREDSSPALFLPKSGRRMKGSDPRISTNYLQMKIAQYRRMLEIVVPISAHTIRHAYATYLVENGANPAAIQILLGHESLQTTTKYVHASDKYAEETHTKFHPAKDE